MPSTNSDYKDKGLKEKVAIYKKEVNLINIDEVKEDKETEKIQVFLKNYIFLFFYSYNIFIRMNKYL